MQLHVHLNSKCMELSICYALHNQQQNKLHCRQKIYTFGLLHKLQVPFSFFNYGFLPLSFYYFDINAATCLYTFLKNKSRVLKTASMINFVISIYRQRFVFVFFVLYGYLFNIVLCQRIGELIQLVGRIKILLQLSGIYFRSYIFDQIVPKLQTFVHTQQADIGAQLLWRIVLIIFSKDMIQSLFINLSIQLLLLFALIYVVV
ncbi:Hypothetical_protein [Hexamita inflata]|uniref:Hypothetical_protein n=1 Tax=Hexamita inflata TaxID=28002 RepID=A0AA86UMI8_9EUKA|nr:Hypothetical protein HINF_LOCUS51840 [Hexamita inflata]